MMKLHKLTLHGRNILIDHLKTDQDNLPDRYLQNIVNGVNEDQIQLIDNNINIDTNEQFGSKYDVGDYFAELFESHSFIPDDDTWNFLSLVYYKQLLNDKGKMGELLRLFLFPENMETPLYNRYRQYSWAHLLRTPYDLCILHKDHSNIKFVLETSPVNGNPEAYREIMRRQFLFRNIEILRTIRLIYFDKKSNKFKRGHVTEEYGIPELLRLHDQYSRGYDMNHLTSDKFIVILLEKHKYLFEQWNVREKIALIYSLKSLDEDKRHELIDSVVKDSEEQ